MVYDLSSGSCKSKDEVPCAQEVVESTVIVQTTQVTPSQSGINSLITTSRLDTASQNLVSTAMEITDVQTASTSDIVDHSTSTYSDIQPTGTILSVTSSAIQG